MLLHNLLDLVIVDLLGPVDLFADGVDGLLGSKTLAGNDGVDVGVDVVKILEFRGGFCQTLLAHPAAELELKKSSNNPAAQIAIGRVISERQDFFVADERLVNYPGLLILFEHEVQDQLDSSQVVTACPGLRSSTANVELANPECDSGENCGVINVFSGALDRLVEGGERHDWRLDSGRMNGSRPRAATDVRL